jgi:hypothetical protein
MENKCCIDKYKSIINTHFIVLLIINLLVILSNIIIIYDHNTNQFQIIFNSTSNELIKTILKNVNTNISNTKMLYY